MAQTKLRQTAAQAPAGRRKLTGPQKAAVLFLCMGESRGSALMQRLETEEIQRITQVMSALGPIPAELVEGVLRDFSEDMTSGTGVIGSYSTAEKLLRSLLPESQVESILRDIRGPLKERDLWLQFGSLSEHVIANYLRDEHDQTIAVILSNVNSDVAARVLPLFAPEKMESVVERMIRMEAVPHHMMRQIEETIQSDIINARAQPSVSEVHQKMAELFNKLDRTAFDTMAEGLEQRVPEAFESIRQKMFTFDDLTKMQPMDLAKVMRAAPGNTLPTALRGASQRVRDVFLNALPGRSRDMLREEMDQMGGVRRRDVNAAQGQILEIARSMAEEELVRPLFAEGEEEVI